MVVPPTCLQPTNIGPDVARGVPVGEHALPRLGRAPVDKPKLLSRWQVLDVALRRTERRRWLLTHAHRRGPSVITLAVAATRSGGPERERRRRLVGVVRKDGARADRVDERDGGVLQ